MHSSDTELRTEHMPMWGILCRLSDPERKSRGNCLSVCETALADDDRSVGSNAVGA